MNIYTPSELLIQYNLPCRRYHILSVFFVIIECPGQRIETWIKGRENHEYKISWHPGFSII
jgi:hypothetical protein